jgi:hypothetical protein
MTRADNSRYLRQAAAARRHHVRQRARQAIEQLHGQGDPITFAAVAATGGVSRTWLYRQDDLRELITRLRADNGAHPRTPASQRASQSSLRQRLQSARNETTHLRAENTELRQRLELRLGEQRALHSTGQT